MSKRTLTLVALAVAAYLLFFRRRAPSRPMPVGVVVGDVYDVESIA